MDYRKDKLIWAQGGVVRKVVKEDAATHTKKAVLVIQRGICISGTVDECSTKAADTICDMLY